MTAISRVRPIGLLTAVTLLATACGPGSKGPVPVADIAPAANVPAAAVASVHAPQDCATVLGGGNIEAVAAAISAQLFASAPIVVLAPAAYEPGLRAAAEKARELGVPILVDSHAVARPAVSQGTAATTGPEGATAGAPPADVGAFDPPYERPTTSAPAAPALAAPAPAAPAPTAPARTLSLSPRPSHAPQVGTPSRVATVSGAPCSVTRSVGPTAAGAVDAAPVTTTSASATDSPTAPATPGLATTWMPAVTDTPAIASDTSCLPTGINAVEQSAVLPVRPVITNPTPAVSPEAAGPTPTSSTPNQGSAAPGASGSPSAQAVTPTATGSVDLVDVPLAERPWVSEIRRLHPDVVLALDPAVAADLAAALPDVRVSTNGLDLPRTVAPKPLTGLTVFAHDYRSPSASDEEKVAALAATADALGAGARVITLPVADPRAGACAVQALSTATPTQVLAIGSDFGRPDLLATRVATASTGRQLPGGGALFFPGRRLVALYGHPDAPELGALGQQGLAASIARAERVGSTYRDLSDAPIVPAFEIIATTAQGSRGDGTYSGKTTVDQLLPWVRQAGAAGMYVVLDLQPGLQNALNQAKLYEPLLSLPWVGLAVDPEWKLQPGQHPLGQIGSIEAAELNSVSRWLSDLTERQNLPQKLFVIHQFRKSMILDESELNTDHDNLAMLIHMDGQGKPSDKDATWKVVKSALPPGIEWLGWKDFYTKDHPTIGPAETMSKQPTPVMISYQ